MSRLLSAKIVAATAVLLTAPACAKKVPPPAVTVVEDEPGSAPDAGAAGDPANSQPRPQGKPVQLQASVEGLGDVLQLVKQATTAWNPKNPIDANAWVQAMLLQLGYGPQMWNSLDLAGVMALDAAFYPEAPTTDLRLTASLAALSAKGILEGMPAGRRPQPLGNGMWELLHGDVRVLLREQPRTLEFALSPGDLERAPAVAQAAAGGRRLKIHAADLPPGMLSADALPGLPAGLRRQVSAVLREATSAAFELDAGTDRDLVLELSADAPFERLGLSPLGAARTQPSALEGRLPAGAALVVAIPWGSPELLHKMLDNLQKQAASVGAGAFEAPIKAVLGSAHSILDQVQNDVVFAVYPGPKGEMTLLIAADVKDEAAARKAAHEILVTANTAITAFNALGGDKKESSFTVTLKDGVKAGAVSGDLLTVGMPKNMANDLEDARSLLTSKQQLEVASLVAGGSAIVTLGFDARKVAADVAGGLKAARKTSLAADGGLVLARAASKGCHFCVGIDPAGLARVAVFADPEMRADKTRFKDLDAAAAVVTRLGGAVGFGLRLEPKKGALAGGLKKSLLVLSPADAAQVGKLWESMAPAPKTEDKPLSGGSKAK